MTIKPKQALSLSKRIERYLKTQNRWVSGLEIELLTSKAGYKASNGSRRCREMVENEILERKENEKGFVEYKYKLQEKTVQKVIIENGRAIVTQQKIFV